MKQRNSHGLILSAVLFIGLYTGFAVAPSSVSAADFGSWGNQMKIVFTGYTRAETLTNFTVLVTFTNIPGFAYSQFLSSSNADLRFTDDSQTRELNYEVEVWDTNGASLVWVQLPLLTGTNTTIWAYWGKARQSRPDYTTNGAAWDPTFRGVWHLDEAVPDEANTGIHLDSTTNHFNGMQDGNHHVAGVMGMAQDFDGNDKISLGAVTTMGAYTKEAWVKLTGGGNLISSSSTHAFWAPGGYLQAGHNNDWSAVSDPAPFPIGIWQHVSVTYDSAVNGGQLTLYRNGVPMSVATGKGQPGPDAMTYFGSHGGGNFFTGQMDEGRISSMARSSNWVWACWMNQASNTVFETATIGIPTVFNLPPSDLTTASATVNGRLGSNRTFEVFVTVYWGTNNCGSEATNWQHAIAFNGAQPAGALSKLITGLRPNQTYFYTYSTSNTSGVAWARPTMSFKTWGPPAVDNESGAVVMDEITATVQGTLRDGHAADGTFYWGANPTNLTNMTRAGLVVEGLFSVSLTNLNKDDTYYYRCFVSNQYGVAWSPSVTNFSTLLSVILKLEQNAEFAKAAILGAAFLAQGRDAATKEALRAVMARLQQEKKIALSLSFAIESLESHRDVAERELAKDPEVGILLLRRVVRERDGALLINAAGMLTAMTDAEVPALIINRLKTCKDRAVVSALIADLNELKDQINAAQVPDLVEILGKADAADALQAQWILTSLAGKEVGTNTLAAISLQLETLATRQRAKEAAAQTNAPAIK